MPDDQSSLLLATFDQIKYTFYKAEHVPCSVFQNVSRRNFNKIK